VRQAGNLDALARLVDHAERLDLYACAWCDGVRGRLTGWPIVGVGKQLQPTSVDVRPVVLGVDEVGDKADVVGAEASAFNQCGQVVPGVQELLGRIVRDVAGLEVDASDARGEEHVSGFDQVR
jgi:hypothetical protein